jgi:hypothetical protein
VTDQIILLLVLGLSALGIFGYSLFGLNQNRLGGLCLTVLLCSTLTILELKGVNSLEFEVLMLVGIGTLVTLILGFRFKKRNGKFNLTLFFWRVTTSLTFFAFLVLANPVYICWINGPFSAQSFPILLYLSDLLQVQIESLYVYLKLIWVVITFASIILAFLIVLFIEWLIVYTLKKMKGGK